MLTENQYIIEILLNKNIVDTRLIKRRLKAYVQKRLKKRKAKQIEYESWTYLRCRSSPVIKVIGFSIKRVLTSSADKNHELERKSTCTTFSTSIS